MATNYFGDDKDQTIVNSSFTSKAQKINLDDEKVLAPDESSRLVSGDINSATKSTIVGGKDVIGGGDNGTLASHTLLGDTIVGDAVNISASTFTGGADKVTLKSMDDAGATVIGDAISVSGGTTRGGADTIIVDDTITGGTIIGDVETVTNSTFTAGNDNIQLKGNVENAEIYTDAKNYNGTNTVSGGNDVVTLGVKGEEGDTTFKDSTINLGIGNDNFTAYSTIAETADSGTTEINGEAGNDRFTITSITGGTNSGGEGNDSFTVTSMSGSAQLTGDAGNDSFKIDTLDAGTADGGADNDTFTITTMNDGTVSGNDGNDIFNLTNVSGGTVNGGADNDRMTATKVIGGTFDGGYGNDTITVTTLDNAAEFTTIIGGESTIDSNGKYGADSISVADALNVKIYGDYSDDTSADSRTSYNDIIKLTKTSTNTLVEAGYGNDSITVATASNSNINGGDDNDTMTVTTANDTSTINGDAGNDNIKVTTLTTSTVDGGAGEDSITISTASDGIVNGGDDDDTIIVTTANGTSTINGGAGDDSIKVTTVTASTVDGGDGADTITINTLQASTIKNGKVTEVDEMSSLDGGSGDDSISVVTLNNSEVLGGSGNDSIKITNVLGQSNIDLGEGHDSLFVSSNKSTALNDTNLANSLGAGNDTLQVNWAFNGTFTSSETSGVADGDTLITKGLGANANLVFGDGNDNLTISGASSGNKTGLTDSQLAEKLGAGQDTLNVGWAFNGAFNTSDGEGETLITKGLNASSTLQFGSGNDGLQVIGALSNRQVQTLDGDDTVSISSTATNVQVDLGTGADVFSVGSMGKGSTLSYDADGLDSITIKGTYNHNTVDSVYDIDGGGTYGFNGLSTGIDGGSITLDTLGSGQLDFGAGADTITINKNVAGTATLKKEISTFGGNDNINLKGIVTNTIVNASFGTDTVSIGALSTGSTLRYAADHSDDITIKGTYNAGFVHTITQSGSFYGLATGDDGGSITLDTLGTGKILFDAGADTLTINKAISGSLGLKDIFMNDGNDSVTLNTVNGAVISGDSGQDYISATSLGATGVLQGDGGVDTIQIGREVTDADSFKATATMNNGVINGGDGDDSIIIGNTLDADNDGFPEDIKGTLSGGKVYGGAGDDLIVTTTLSGSGLMDGGAGADVLNVNNVSGGSMNGGDDGDFIAVTTTFSRGTINGGEGDDWINIFNPTSATATATMTGGTINGGVGEDNISIQNLKGGVINTNDDAGADSITIDTMTGGTINSGAGDEIEISTMNGGVINDSADDNGSIYVATMTKGTINGNGGDDQIYVDTMNGGTVNGQDGDDILTVEELNGGTVNAGEGDNEITIKYDLSGGSIIGGTGNDTLVLSDGVELSGKYSINLGAGDNEIKVQSNLDGQSLVLGSSHDNVNLTAATENAKINLGTGNDTIIAKYLEDEHGTVIAQGSIENTIIDGNSGNDSIDITTANAGTFIYAGVGNDTIKIATAIDAVIDAGTGSDLIDVSDLQGTSFITHDTAGQDTLILSDYEAGMVVGAGGKNEINTGTDGGKIELGTWTSGDITFGNGHDAFVLHDANGLNKSIDLKSGNDSVSINGFNGGTISYHVTGSDSIEINDEYDGTGVKYTTNNKTYVDGLSTGTDGGFIHVNGLTAAGVDALSFSTKNDHFSIDTLNVDGKTIDLKTGTDSITVNTLTAGTIIYDSVGLDSITIEGVYNGTGVQGYTTAKGAQVLTGLTTGTDGGFIHVGSLTEDGADALSFSDKNDHFSIDSLKVLNADGDPSTAAKEINLQKGTDSITIESLTDANASIIYDNAGLDSIVIKGEYKGTGVEAQDGKLSTGADGGYISIGEISTEAGVDGLAFSAKNDTFEIGTLNVDGLNDANEPIGMDTISLDAGNDSVTVTTFIDGTIDLGDGNDKFSATDIMGGTVDAGNGNDSINVSNMDGGGIVAGLGNDSLSLGAVSGAVVGDAGGLLSVTANYTGSVDKITIESLEGNAAIYGDFYEVIADVDNAGQFTIKGGNDVITVNGDITGDGNKVLIYGDLDYIADAKTLTAGNDNITLKGNVNNAFISGDVTRLGSQGITFNGGIDTVTLGIKGQEGQTLVTNTTISLNHGNDVLNAYSTLGAGVKIYGGDGNDKFTISTMTDGEVYGDHPYNPSDEGNDAFFITNMTGGTADGGVGNDNFNITTLNGGTTDGGVGNDVFTLKNFESGTAIGNDGSDKFTITTMTGGTVYGDDDGDDDGGTTNLLTGNDTISVTTMTGGTIEGGMAAITNGKYGADSITVKNATDAFIYGDKEVYDTDPAHDPVADPDTSGLLEPYEGKSYNDIIKITGTAENTYIDGGYGVDNITVATFKDGELYGGAGDDKITVTTGIGLDVGFGIDGGDGNDSITMTTLNRGGISGGAGTDVITVKNAYGSFIVGDDPSSSDTSGDIIKITGLAESTYIHGSYGSDSITVGNATAGTEIHSAGGNDTIKVTTLTDSKIYSGVGDDEITVTNQLKTAVNFDNDSGSDEIFLTGGIGAGAEVSLSGDGDFTVAKSSNNAGFNMNGGELNGSAGVDNIYLGTFSGGNINTGDGADKLNLTTFSGGTINTGAGADIITVTNAINKTVSIENGADAAPDTVDTDNLYLTKGIVAGANITLEGDGGFNVAKNEDGDGFAMSGGTLTGSYAADTFTLSSMTNGGIHGGSGNDIFNITLNGASKGILYGGSGADVFNLTATKESSITIQDFEVGDSIIIGGDTITADMVVGKDSITVGDITINLGTVHVDPDNENKLEFDNISNKTIYGTNGADTINIKGTATKGGITGLDDADSISVGTLSSSVIYGDEGADTITVGTVNGGHIDGGSDADFITITNQVKKSVTIGNFDAAQDSLYLTGGIGSGGNVELQGAGGGFVVAQSVDATDPDHLIYTGFNLASGTLTGSDGADKFFVEKMSSGTLAGEAGEDTFSIITLSGGTVNGGADADSINITTMTGGTVDGGAGADSINITTMTGGTVDGGAGADTTTITSDINKVTRINNTGVENDTVYLAGDVVKGGNVTLTSNVGFELAADYDTANNTFNGITIDGGIINGSAGDDSIHVAELKSGTINGNAGNDLISIESRGTGTINGGTGEDTLALGGEVSSELKLSTLASNVEAFEFDELVAGGSIVGTDNNESISVNTVTAGAINAGAGNDSISVNTVTAGSIDGGVGEDTLEINASINSAVDLSTLASNVEAFEFDELVENGDITGTDNADNITIDSMSGGALNAGAGDDIITINGALTGGSIDGGDGDNTLYFKGVTSAEVDLSLISNVQNIIFNEVSTDGIVTGTDLADNITIAKMTGGAINTGLENDKITLKTLPSAGTIDGGDGQDTLFVDMAITTNLYTSTLHSSNVESYEFQSLEEGGTINGDGYEDDNITVYNLNGGTINGSGGFDKINLYNTPTSGHITDTGGEDTVFFKGVVESELNLAALTSGIHDFEFAEISEGANISGLTRTDVEENITIKNITGGSINTVDGDDSITINAMSDGEVNGGAGNDSITVETMTGGEVNGGAGNDHITLNSLPTDGIIKGGENFDTLTINPEITSEVKLADLASEVEEFVFDSLAENGNIIGTDEADNITVLSMTGGNINAGDGNDTIALTALPSVGAIDGGAGEYDELGLNVDVDGDVNISDLAQNVEVFNFQNLVTGGTITGTDGNDSIIVQKMSGGTITAGAGDDLIAISGALTDGSIDGGDGDNDTVYFRDVRSAEVDLSLISNVEKMIFSEVATDGIVTGTAGDDSITVQAMSGGEVHLGAGNDTIILESVPTGGVINGGDSSEGDTLRLDMNLSITVILDSLATDVEHFEFSNIVNEANVLGTAEADDVTIEAMSGGRVYTGAGGDEITLKSLPTGGTIDGGSGTDKLSLAMTIDTELNLGALADNIERFSFDEVTTNANIIGTDDNDTISITTMTGGSINTGLGNDTVTLHNIPTGDATINGGEGEDVLSFGSDVTINTTVDLGTLTSGFDSFTFNELTTNGNIIGTDESDYINVINMDGGAINAGDGYDTVIVANTMTTGTINAGAGEDSIEIRNMPTVDTINGGLGTDTLFMDITVNTEVDFDTLVDGVEVYHISKLTTGGHIMGTDSFDNKIVVNTMEGGTITLSNVQNFITINSIPTGGLIEGGTNYDSLYLNTIIDDAVDLGTLTTGVERFEFQGLAAGGMITGTSDKDIFVLNTVPTGGVIDGVSGSDVLHIDTSIDSVLNLDAISDNINNFYTDDIVENADITGTGSADQITVRNDMSGGTLNSGADDDHIIISKSFTGGFIDGGEGADILELQQGISTEVNLETLTDNIETFTFDTLNSGGKIIGTDQNDDIHIGAINGGSVDGGAGVDTLSIRDDVDYELNLSTSTSNIDVFEFRGVVEGGNVIGTNENDEFTIHDMTGGSINAGAGNDAIVLMTISTDGTIDGGEDYDRLHIEIPSITSAVNLEELTDNVEEFIFNGLADGGNIIGTADNDKIDVTTLSGGSINAGAGNDTILLNSVPASGSIDGGGGNEDRLELDVTVSEDLRLSDLATNVEHFQFEEIAASGSITGTALNDNIVIAGSMTGGNISTGAGTDTITLNSIPTDGSIDGGDDEYDSLSFENIIVNDDIDLEVLTDNVEIFSFDAIAGGTITGTSEADSFSITTLSGGTINTGDGADSIILHSAPTGGTINGGDGIGHDTLAIHADITNILFLDTLTSGIERFEFGTLAADAKIGDGIHGTTEGEHIQVDNMISGLVSGAGGNDVIGITNMLNGKIDGGDGDDDINVVISAETENATLFGGAGADQYAIDGAGEINISGFDKDGDKDRLFINGTDVTDSVTGEASQIFDGITIHFGE